MKKTITKFGVTAAALLPAIAFAQQKDLKYIIGLIVTYFNYAVYLIMGLAVVLFVWNIFKYFIKGGDDVGAKKEAGMYVLWSVVGFFVILSFWGMVNILTNTFKLDSSQPSGFFGTFGSSSGVNTSPFTQRSGGTTVTPTSAGTTITPNSAGTTERRGLLTGVRDFFVEGW